MKFLSDKIETLLTGAIFQVRLTDQIIDLHSFYIVSNLRSTTVMCYVALSLLKAAFVVVVLVEPKNFYPKLCLICL